MRKKAERHEDLWPVNILKIILAKMGKYDIRGHAPTAHLDPQNALALRIN